MSNVALTLVKKQQIDIVSRAVKKTAVPIFGPYFTAQLHGPRGSGLSRVKARAVLVYVFSSTFFGISVKLVTLQFFQNLWLHAPVITASRHGPACQLYFVSHHPTTERQERRESFHDTPLYSKRARIVESETESVAVLNTNHL